MYMECKYCYCGTADKTQNNHYYKTFQLLHQFWTFSNQNLPIFGIEHFYFPCKIRKPLHNSVSTLDVCSANDIVSCYTFQSELRIFHHCRPLHIIVHLPIEQASYTIYLPSFCGRGLLTTYWRTSSSLDRLNSFLILLALLGPRRRGMVVSVRPGMSFSPKHTDIYKCLHKRTFQMPSYS